MVRRMIKAAMSTVAAALITTVILVAPVWAEPPIQVPAQHPTGSTFVVPAPCRLTPSDRLTYEFDPLFQSPTYYIQFLDGPAGADGSVRRLVPTEATPGRYVLRGTCSIVRREGEVSSPLDQYAIIDPVEVELVVGSASADTGEPGYTG